MADAPDSPVRIVYDAGTAYCVWCRDVRCINVEYAGATTTVVCGTCHGFLARREELTFPLFFNTRP